MESAKIDLKKTIHLPQTGFSMKANLAQLEPKLLAQWDATGLYERIREARKGRPTYILHDGPPYANGNIHLGHALQQNVQGFHRESEEHGGLRFSLRPRLGLPRPAHRNQGR